MKILFIFITVLAAFASCSPTTQMQKSWRDPAATFSRGANNKVLAIAFVKDESSRRVVEDNIVKAFKGKAIASYTILTSEVVKSAKEEDLKKIIVAGGYTHVLLLRLADIEKETSYVPGTTTGYYGGYGSFYGYGAGMYSSPGYYTVDKNYFVETMVYSVSPDKLLWAGTTRTINPGKIEKTVREIADVITEQMNKEGFLVN